LLPNLGPVGPFPDAPLGDHLERRWLHYAFRSPSGDVSVIANLSTLGSSGPAAVGQSMSILLVHDREAGWHSSQFNASVTPRAWSSFGASKSPSRMRISSPTHGPSVDLRLTRTGRPCTSQCAPFGLDQHLRWQSEPGIRATGVTAASGGDERPVRLVGYHERVRGRWGWPDLGGWVFGFVNDTPAPSGPPAYSVVFTLITPRDNADAATGSVMLWRSGRLVRHFPRRRIDVAVSGSLSRDDVHVLPPLAATLGTAPTAEVPARLVIVAQTGDDRLCIDVDARTAGRIVNSSELGLAPFSVHEVLGPAVVTGHVGGRQLGFTAGAVVEFAGGAHAD
jgi:hypothetical protein